jgi:ABC-type transport system involved in cytochrome bd biosynthesis fused ATPase/permease subunit
VERDGVIRRLVGLAVPESRGIALAALLQVLTLGAGVGLMGTSAWLLSKAALHPSIAALGVAIVGVRFFGLSRGILRYLERLVSHDVTLRLLSRLRGGVYRALVPLAPARLLEHRGGDLLGRVVEDVGTLENLYVRVLGPSLSAALFVSLVGGLLLSFGAGIAAVAVGGLVLAGVAIPALAVPLGTGPGRRLVATRGALAALLTDGVLGTGDLLAFGREADHAARIDALGRELTAEQSRLVRASALVGASAVLAADLTVVGVLALAIPAVRGGELAGVNLAVVALLALASFEAVAALPAAWQGLGATRAAAERLFDLLDTPPAVREPRPAETPTAALRAAALPAPPPGALAPSPSRSLSPEAGDPAAPPPPGRPALADAPGPTPTHSAPIAGRARDAAEGPLLEIRALAFTYPGEPRPALEGIDLRLDRDRRVAVVGASGSGKSTLAHLILRFWDVPARTIALEGRDVITLSSDEVRGKVAFAAQRAHLFAGTLLENLRLARSGATRSELEAALRAVCLEDLLSRLPDGLDTWIGEQGLTLSGGERQRVALARALLRPAPILLLDEPTAHLDAVTERAVIGGILAASDGRAALLITHRLVGLEAFDEVVVLQGGRIAERGRATDLAARDGVFADMLGRQRSRGALRDEAFGGGA